MVLLILATLNMSLARTASYGNEDNQWITISPRPWTQSIMLMYVDIDVDRHLAEHFR